MPTTGGATTPTHSGTSSEIPDLSDMDHDKVKGSIKVKRHSSGKTFARPKPGSLKKKELRSSRSLDFSSGGEMEMLTQKQNGSLNALSAETEEDEHEDKKEHTATIKGLWKKAFKSLKSGDQKWLVKKSSSLKRKDSKEVEEVEPEEPTEIDPVYSLLKCAADLPKVSRGGKDSAGASGGLVARHGDSSGSTSKASSPSSSGPRVPQCQCCASVHDVDLLGPAADFKQYYKLTTPKRTSSLEHLL